MAPAHNRGASILWLAALGVAVVVLMVATVLRGERSPIPQLWAGVIVIGAAWATAARLRSPAPVIRDWFQYVRSFVVLPPIVVGGLWLAVWGGPELTVAVRVICGLVALGAAVFLLTDVRDFRLWRVEVRQHR